VDAHVFEAKDTLHNPTESFETDTTNALNRFENFNINMDITFYYGFWDASDIHDDLAEDTSWVVNSRNDIVIGWVDYSDRNGIAYPNGTWDLDKDGVSNFAPYALCAVKSAGIDWPHDSIAQHETSHLFGANDHTSGSFLCIMDYYWAKKGVNWWCDDCESCVANNINPQI